MGVLTSKDFTPNLITDWKTKRVAFVDPELWNMPSVTADQSNKFIDAANRIEGESTKAVRNALLPQYVEFVIDRRDEWSNGQAQLTDALGELMSDESYESAKKFMCEKARLGGFDKIFSEHGVDVLVAPHDCRVGTIAAIAGYPIGIAPLGHADFNDRGFPAELKENTVI
ncbi:hypothetical protein QQS21_007110 [Conoideocrella luteorostrata]|uniref:Amidase domain-containing protein n=1 Tax=Conoideocrella luteorostrata TaxID=1105319 RepID=A0AAJ0CLP4_9HYPO|nr:hypothetical protein QQS21_007110 [Conoideocrella luteorostrata]